jgi:hypothetical protein
MKNFFSKIKWYHISRGMGLFAATYELLFDHSADRGTVILAAFGLMGLEFVTRKSKD